MPSTPSSRSFPAGASSWFFRRALSALVLFPSLYAVAAPVVDGPDPREIPLPPLSAGAGRFPGPAELPEHPALPEALRFSDGTPVVSREQWTLRREEMRRILEYYAVGHAPPAPGNVRGEVLKTQTLANGRGSYRLVRLRFGPKSALSLHIGIFVPPGKGPFPAVIFPGGTPPGAEPLPRLKQGPGQGKGVNALLFAGDAEGTEHAAQPAKLRPVPDAETVAAENPALARGYAYVVFENSDCGEDTTLRRKDGSWAYRETRFFPAYPEYDWGLLRCWAWGVSRIVDYLETQPDIDPGKLCVTGVSRTGKSALVAGAFDERLALVAPVVTGGGGIGAYRFSGAGRGGKEGLGDMMRKYPNWFSPKLRAFWGYTDRLPFDEHWFLALCAPRALIALEGRDDAVSLANAVCRSWLGARPAYALLGATDRLGVNYGNHGHAFTPEDWRALLDFADKQLLGKPVERSFVSFPEDLLDPSTVLLLKQ